ncbi:MAG: hypothetical protein J6O04_00255 [Selenomonadaceae bacterium]|nr:hypothetical protein [Selenomonadaceae bacterium]
MKKIILLLACAFFCFADASEACTLFAANGDRTKDGGSLIVKNRDEKPSEQTLMIDKKGKYKFYGLYAKSDGKWSLKGGVNEKGLAVVTAAASSIPKSVRNNQSTKGALKRLLANCSTVEQALSQGEYFSRPQFIMIADKDEIAYVEVGLNNYAVKRVKNNVLSHTNHYLLQSTSEGNIKISASSKYRLNRIENLLKTKKQFTLDDFIEFSKDRKGGDAKAIWRNGLSEKGSQSLAVLAIHIKKDGDADIYVRLRRKPEDKGNEDVVRIAGKDIFGK